MPMAKYSLLESRERDDAIEKGSAPRFQHPTPQRIYFIGMHIVLCMLIAHLVFLVFWDDSRSSGLLPSELREFLHFVLGLSLSLNSVCDRCDSI
jgi:hypothetical protein